MYILFYTKSCTPHVKTFKTKQAATKFAKDFMYVHESADDWIDFLVKGTIEKTFKGAEGVVVEND